MTGLEMIDAGWLRSEGDINEVGIGKHKEDTSPGDEGGDDPATSASARNACCPAHG